MSPVLCTIRRTVWGPPVWFIVKIALSFGHWPCHIESGRVIRARDSLIRVSACLSSFNQVQHHFVTLSNCEHHNNWYAWPQHHRHLVLCSVIEWSIVTIVFRPNPAAFQQQSRGVGVSWGSFRVYTPRPPNVRKKLLTEWKKMCVFRQRNQVTILCCQ